MWTYKQSTGDLLDAEGHKRARGYSGRGAGLNMSTLQSLHGREGDPDAGPIVRGKYTICGPVDKHGGFALPLEPDPANDMRGRGSFMIHGDLLSADEHPHQASLGCIILPRDVRVEIWQSEDHLLEVVA